MRQGRAPEALKLAAYALRAGVAGWDARWPVPGITSNPATNTENPIKTGIGYV